MASTLCRWLRVSSLIGYLLVGLVIGQGGFGFVVDANHEIEHLAELGVFLLLFAIGLEFSLDDLRRLGKSMLIGGSIQMSLVAIPVRILAPSEAASEMIGLYGASATTCLIPGTYSVNTLGTSSSCHRLEISEFTAVGHFATHRCSRSTADWNAS